MITGPNRVKEIFLGAFEHADEAARAAYLERACEGDVGLRDRIETLLRSHETAGSFLGTPAVKPVETSSSATQELAFNATEDDDAEVALKFLQPSTRPDSLGRLGHYDVLQVLGRGGFGIVLRAFDDILQRVVAVKALAPELAATSPARKRFLREARSSAKVRHENIVQVYAVEEQPLPYLVMEFIPGETLQQRLDRTGPLDAIEMVRIGRQIAEGLAAAHSTGLIHRDIKPANILIEAGPHERVKITDFGLARAADDASLTQSGFLAGTPMFMAPEQARGETLDHRADLFSLGSVLYQMASGRPPFRAPTTLAVLKRVADEPARPITEIIPETPNWLCAIIAKLHAKNPDQRFQSAREVADLLADCETKLKAKQVVRIDLPVASVKPAGPSASAGRTWFVASAVLLLPVIVLTVAEFAGVTGLLSKPSDDPKGDLVAKLPLPDLNVNTPIVKAPNQTNGKVKVADLAPAPTIHDTWLKAIALLPLDQHAAALSAKLKEQLPEFDAAFLNAIAATPADRQATMAEAWLSERKPAFAGNDAAWLKAIPTMPADTQATLVVAWLKECNSAFAGDVTPKIDGNVVAAIDVSSPLVQDLAPLRALVGLRTLTARSTLGTDSKAEGDAALLRSLTKLETINGKPVAQFWKDVDAKQAEFKDWLKLVPALDARQQVEAVSAKLKDHNPGFAGIHSHKIEDGVVTEIVLACYLADLTPVRALVGLKAILCDQLDVVDGRLLQDLSALKDLKQLTSLSLQFIPIKELTQLKDLKLTSLAFNNTAVSDLTPIKDLPLTSLSLYMTQVTDLALLSQLKLTSLSFGRTGVTDLSPLKHMKLTQLDLHESNVTELAPLKGMPLTSLNIYGTQVTDLTPLQGMSLTELDCARAKISDLSPLQGMPLTKLFCHESQVSDLSPLKGMPLEQIRLTPKNITKGMDVLRAMTSLKTIGINTPETHYWPADQFWERFDKGEFK